MNLIELSAKRRSINTVPTKEFIGISYQKGDVRMYCGDDNCDCNCHCPCNPDISCSKDELLQLI